MDATTGRLRSLIGNPKRWAMSRTAPVSDWATDFDVLDPGYITDPFSIWDDLRAPARSPTPSGG